MGHAKRQGTWLKKVAPSKWKALLLKLYPMQCSVLSYQTDIKFLHTSVARCEKITFAFFLQIV